MADGFATGLAHSFMPQIAAAMIIGGLINGALYTARAEKWDWAQFTYAVGTGAVGGALGFGIGNAFTPAANISTGGLILNETARAGAHGISGYIMSSGSMSGFYSGALSSLAGSFSTNVKGVVGEALNTTLGGTIFAAGVGGGISKISGGNFWQGAAIGATVHLVNQDKHKRSAKDFIPDGYIKLEGLSDEQLADIRIIPENKGDDLIVPKKNGLYTGDGFYFRGGNQNKYWYKVSNGGGVYVTVNNSSISGYNLMTQPHPNRFWRSIANFKNTEYYIGWKPISQPHSSTNPFIK